MGIIAEHGCVVFPRMLLEWPLGRSFDSAVSLWAVAKLLNALHIPNGATNTRSATKRKINSAKAPPLANESAIPAILQKILGHGDIRSTMKYNDTTMSQVRDRALGLDLGRFA